MYLITTYGNWDYECYAYDFATVPPTQFETALKAIVESGEEIWSMHDGLHAKVEANVDHKTPDKVFVWDILRWVEDEDYGKE